MFRVVSSVVTMTHASKTIAVYRPAVISFPPATIGNQRRPGSGPAPAAG